MLFTWNLLVTYSINLLFQILLISHHNHVLSNLISILKQSQMCATAMLFRYVELGDGACQLNKLEIEISRAWSNNCFCYIYIFTIPPYCLALLCMLANAAHTSPKSLFSSTTPPQRLHNASKPRPASTCSVKITKATKPIFDLVANLTPTIIRGNGSCPGQR